ncbi:S8 family peptidase [Chitinophaga sp. LS1]|uniref:S8 family peptidase n=1 Tax=Chitinophaga sp. LS1 TaxID=3051176 RepID=UPI002AAAE391|nr:S8 family peptidase [Chitinophaga sp. LS1]WPV65144.1 S8 family peptidase [Chitinophaga sp. LS1]
MKSSGAIAVMAGCVAMMTALTTNSAYAQGNAVPKNWHLLDYAADSVYGTSVQRAYTELLKGRKSTPVIVAVIDSGIDTLHEDLKSILWTNPKEIPGNGIDDDKNGYVDDVHGWNFLGGKDGRSLKDDSDEATREYVRLKDKYVNPDSALNHDSKEYNYWLKVSSKIAKPSTESKTTYRAMLKLQDNVNKAGGILTTFLHTSDFSVPKLDSIQTKDEDVMVAKNFMIRLFNSTGDSAITYADFKPEFEEYIEDLKKKAEISDNYTPNAKRKEIVGDDINDINDKYYGNNDVMGQFGLHGTHVSGIIAAARNNGVGMDGVADNVRIMAVKAVPDGDERDKDVALAIRYAVDNGARIINMSFGKSFSPHKDWVDAAFKYAADHNVLLIHAAGNDGKNVDSTDNFPNADFLNGGVAGNVVTVGATSNGKTGAKVASFSNYGKRTVDLFAPGVSIYATLPGGNKYGSLSGTSMACPVVAGVAALVLSYYPDLTAEQLKYVLLKSAVPLPDGTKEVTKPGAPGQTVAFADLSATGGLVNAYNALKVASTMKVEKLGKKPKVMKIKKG